MGTTPVAPAAPAPAAPAAPAPVAPVAPVTPAPTPAPAVESTPAPVSPAAPQADWQPKAKRSDFPDSESYARALTQERLDLLKQQTEGADTAQVEPPKTAEAQAAPATEQGQQAPAEQKAPEAEPFKYNRQQAFNPESLSEAIKGDTELGRLLEAKPELSEMFYQTARDAAQTKKYQQVFPDIKAAEFAKSNSTQFVNVRETFMKSTTLEGAQATIGKIAELCYERDAQGNVIMENGKPVIGDDFFGFIDNTVQLDLKERHAQTKAALDANRYKSDEERDQDERRLAALDVLLEDFKEPSKGPGEEAPQELKDRWAELERRENALRESEQQRVGKERADFEGSLVKEANSRITSGIKGILESVKKQGGMIQPYLEQTLLANIGDKLSRAAQSDSTLRDSMLELQKLPPGTDAFNRRIEIVDRAIQNLLPDIANQELKEAGVVWTEAQTAKSDKQAAQTAVSKTEPKGSTGPANPTNTQRPANAQQAWDQAKEVWEKANPGRSANDPGVKDTLMRMATNLMLGKPAV